MKNEFEVKKLEDLDLVAKGPTPASPLYQAIAALRPGECVVVSGREASVRVRLAKAHRRGRIPAVRINKTKDGTFAISLKNGRDE